MRLSANLGFLLTDYKLPDAIRRAKTLGFCAVECHWPYSTDPGEVSAALVETGLPMLGLNTSRGNAAAGDFGLAALPGRKDEARTAIDQAIAYAARIDCANVHIMAGKADGAQAWNTFSDNLRYAADKAGPHGIGILIEPLNTRDVPGYLLTDLCQTCNLIDSIGMPSLRIMFDCYHMQIMGGDLLRRIESALPLIGHLQIAAVPDRAEPDHGEVDYGWLLPAITKLGYRGYFGAEYKPATSSFAWLAGLNAGGM